MIYNDFLNHLTESLNPALTQDRELIKKAIGLYRQGKGKIHSFQDHEVIGSIWDVKKYDIVLQLENPYMSTCTCNQTKLCVHKTSLFFLFFSRFSSVSMWLEQWKNSRDHFKEYPLFLNNIIENNYSAWSAYFDEILYYLLPTDGDFTSVDAQLLHNQFEEIVEQNKPTDHEWALLYKSIAYLSSLKRIWALEETEITIELNQQFFSYFKTVLNLYKQSPIFFQADAFHHSLLLETRRELFSEASFSFVKWQTYRLLWSTRLSTFKQRIEEIHFLKENPQGEFSQWALIHLFLTNKEDSVSIQLLNDSKLTQIENTLILFHEFISKKEFSRALPFLEWMTKEQLSYVRNLSNSDIPFRIFSKQMRQIALETNRIDLLEKLYKECLPATTREYLSYLYNQKNYAKWVEVLFLFERDNLPIYHEDIAKIEKGEPEIILPIYHFEIQKCISQKDRSSYKHAARLLQQLRAIYTRLHLEAEWDAYLSKLILMHKRLRAFQDELKRWNLYASSDE